LQEGVTIKYEAIIFDLGGVYFTDGTKNAIENLSSLYGVNKRSAYDVFYGAPGIEYRNGIINRKEFYEVIRIACNLPNISDNVIDEIWLNGYKPIRGTIDIINKLKRGGYKVFFLSGNAADRAEYLESKYRFTNQFNGGLFSYNVKISKLNISLYRMMLEKLGNEPSKCIYIDDKVEYLSLAKQLGIYTICFTTPESLEARLIELYVY